MAYEGSTIHGHDQIVDELSPFGKEVPDEAEKLVWEHSSFDDPGPDWNRARLFDADGNELGVIKIDGY